MRLRRYANIPDPGLYIAMICSFGFPRACTKRLFSLAPPSVDVSLFFLGRQSLGRQHTPLPRLVHTYSPIFFQETRILRLSPRATSPRASFRRASVRLTR